MYPDSPPVAERPAFTDAAMLQSAEQDFNTRFYAYLRPSRPHPDLRNELRKVFDETVGYAILHCRHVWNVNSDADKFALDRVADIAMLAKYTEGSSGRVTPASLRTAADAVVGYWRPLCAARTVFCEGYPAVAPSQAGTEQCTPGPRPE